MKTKSGIKRMLALCMIAVSLFLLLPVQQADAVPSQAEVDEKIRWIIASIPDDCDTDYEKALWLHDYLCKTVVYDLAYSADEAYNPLIYGRADCGGYADAYTKLLRAVGIASAFVSGGTAQSTHAWNIIMLDGKCYFTDVTWDDINPFDYINYGYFMISFEKMEKDHAATLVHNSTLYHIFLPEECNHNDYDYRLNYKDTGKPGSGHFNNSTTAEEAAKHFKVVAIEGSTLFWQCEFEFDGDAADWVNKTERQLDKLLGGYTRVHGGMDGYGVWKYECPNSVFTQIDSISFAESTVYLNNNHMRQQLSVSFSPANASFQEVTYSSSDSRIAKVDENGVVRAVSSGTATITATALDGKTATCQVVVDHPHDAIRYVPAVTANCVSKGYKAHYTCDSCGSLFSDSKGQNAVSLMDVVTLPTGYCSYLNYNTYHNEEGHWKICRLCGRWGNKWVIPHEDWDGDGICDGFGSSYQPCGYVMDPSVVKPTQATTKPTQSTTQPAQSESTPTQPSGVPTEPVTETTEPVTDATTLPASSETPTQTQQIGSTDGSVKPETAPNDPNNPPAAPFQWIALAVTGAIAVTIVIILIVRRRKK